MKNSETDRELTDLIRTTLDSYEEQYVLGSWENFVRKRQKRRIFVFWLSVSGIAASLLIGWLGFKAMSPSGNGDAAGQQALQTAEAGTGLARDSITVHRPLPLKDSELLPARVRESESKAAMPESTLALAENMTAPVDEKSVVVAETKKEETTEGKQAKSVNLPDSSGKVTVYGSTSLPGGTGATAESKTPGRRLRLGFSVSPGVASTSSSSAFAWAGGISADIPLTGKLRLSTGLQVERQSIKHAEPSYMSSVPAGSRTASLVDFDLPLNLTWKFYAGKSSGYYVSGGVSSVLYLSEKYTSTSYSQQMVEVVVVEDGHPSISYELENVKMTSETSATPLSNFDLAGRINLIFGYEQQLSSKISLHFEPYLKLPLSGLAGQDMKYTTSGLNCRITF